MTETVNGIAFVCEFCGGSCTAGYTAEGSPFVTHTLPQCRTFEREHPTLFLRLNRRRRAAREAAHLN